ncbi:MerR family transcriptional regulator [bacterium]|nr:MerR family transcriptional regulator [bacterium]
MKYYTLGDVSKLSKISVNSLRYHLKQVPALFKNIKRDRYNRFLFVESDVRTFQSVQELKTQGISYKEILRKYIETEFLEHSPKSTNSVLLMSDHQEVILDSLDTIRTKIQEQTNHILSLEDKLLEESKKIGYLQKVNKILYEKNQHFEKTLIQQQSCLDSLEERVSILVDLQTKSILGEPQ